LDRNPLTIEPACRAATPFRWHCLLLQEGSDRVSPRTPNPIEKVTLFRVYSLKLSSCRAKQQALEVKALVRVAVE
jgi:hypothetical protein